MFNITGASILASATAAADSNGNRKAAGWSAGATANRIVRMSAFLVRRFDIPASQARIAAADLYNNHGLTLSKMERTWGEATGDIIRQAVAQATLGR